MSYKILCTHRLKNLNLNIKALSKIVADKIPNHFDYFSEKIRLGTSHESSARQIIHMNCQALFFLKKMQTKIKMSSAAVVISILSASYLFYHNNSKYWDKQA